MLDIVAASTDLLPVLVVGAPLRYRHRIYNTAVVIHRGVVLGVAPKSYLPTYREFYERRQIAPGDDERGIIRIAEIEAPFGAGPVVRGIRPARLRAARRNLRGHVRAGSAQRASRAGGSDGAGQPVRQPDHDRPRRRPVPARPLGVVALPGRLCLRRRRGGRVDDRPGMGRPDHDLGERCTARRIRAFPEGRATLRRRRRHSSCCAPNDCGWARSTTTGATTVRRRSRSGASSFAWIRRPVTSGCGARSSGSRSCRPIRNRLQQDCYEAYNIQVAGLEQRLRALHYPKVVIGISGGLDSTHALIVAARAMDREERPRSDILAFTLPGFATGEHTKRNAVELCCALGVTFAEIDITDTAKLMLKEIDHPFARGERGLRRHLRERPGRACAPTTCSGWPTSAAASCWAPATCPSWGWAGRHTVSATRCRTTTSMPACPRR